MRIVRALLLRAMKRTVAFALLITASAVGAAAQSGTAAPPASKTVAVVNGETITAEKLDALWSQMPTQARDQYEKSGGKAAFLENYVRKRLLIQEAYKVGFDKRPEVREELQTARDSALFDTYVRDEVATKIVTNKEIRAYYDQHPKDFAMPERVHVRSIVITSPEQGPHARSKKDALALISQVASQLHTTFLQTRSPDPAATAQMHIDQFAQLARKYSEDDTAASGGDLGWIVHGQLTPEVDAAAFALPLGVPSGILESKLGYHILLVDAKEAAGTQSFEQAKQSIREFLIAQRMPDIMDAVTKLTYGLAKSGKVAIFPENIK